MLEGIKSLFGHKEKKKTGGISAKTRVIPFRLAVELVPVLFRRADNFNGGNISEYVAHKLDLTRNHHKGKGEYSE